MMMMMTPHLPPLPLLCRLQRRTEPAQRTALVCVPSHAIHGNILTARIPLILVHRHAATQQSHCSTASPLLNRCSLGTAQSVALTESCMSRATLMTGPLQEGRARWRGKRTENPYEAEKKNASSTCAPPQNVAGRLPRGGFVAHCMKSGGRVLGPVAGVSAKFQSFLLPPLLLYICGPDVHVN